MSRHSPLLGILFTAFSGVALADASSTDSLYARLGGEAQVVAIVNDSVDDVAAKSASQLSFGADLREIKQQVAAQICSLAGGGCRVPQALQFSDSQFITLLDRLRESMRTRAVPLPLRNELLEALAPLRRHPAPG